MDYGFWILESGGMGGPKPIGLPEGTPVKRLGLRSEAGCFYLEMAAGRIWPMGEGVEFKGRGTTLDLVAGTRLWDVWRWRYKNRRIS